MKRRDFLMLLPAVAVAERETLALPIHFVVDGKAKLAPSQMNRFWWSIWPEAAGCLGKCGIRTQTTCTTGEIWRPPDRQPMITGLEHRAINLVITDQIPVTWDNGRDLSGVTTLYRSYQVCMIALNRAHGNEIPFLSVNTCLHELLHALLHDIFENRPAGYAGHAREVRVDWFATRLWLFHDGGSLRASADRYVERLRRPGQARTSIFPCIPPAARVS